MADKNNTSIFIAVFVVLVVLALIGFVCWKITPGYFVRNYVPNNWKNPDQRAARRERAFRDLELGSLPHPQRAHMKGGAR